MNKYKDLYLFLQKQDNKFDLLSFIYKDNDISNNEHGRLLEGLFCLFSYLGLISNFIDYIPTKGNFKKGTLTKLNNLSEILDKSIKQGDDVSDLTLYNKKNNKELIITTVKSKKNLQDYDITKLDIDKIKSSFDGYKSSSYSSKGYTFRYCIVVIDKKIIYQKVSNCHDNTYKEIIKDDKNILIDVNDLQLCYNKFIKIYKNKNIDDVIEQSITKYNYIPKFHQEVCINKMFHILIDNNQNILLLGCIPRSGKTYIIVGFLIKLSKVKSNLNILLITTAPTETIPQYIEAFNCNEFNNFEILLLNENIDDNKYDNSTKKNKIIIASFQYLKMNFEVNKYNVNINKKTEWLETINFDYIITDESHNGASTTISQNIFDYYKDDNTKSIYMTATYIKPVLTYDIPINNQVLFDLEDINLLKNIDNIKCYNRLNEKFDNNFVDVLQHYKIEDIINEYNNTPQVVYFTRKLTNEAKEFYIQDNIEDNYGYSYSSLFNMKKDLFEDKSKILDLFTDIFGNISRGRKPAKSNDNTIFNRIKKYDEKLYSLDRFNNSINPISIMINLPSNNINDISIALKNLLQVEHSIFKDDNTEFIITYINSKTKEKPMTIINNGLQECKDLNRKYLIILNARQCTLGISLNECDIVIMLNDSKSFDFKTQLGFRALTPTKYSILDKDNKISYIYKKAGYIVDLNINESINYCYNYASLINNNQNSKDVLSYLLKQQILVFNPDDYDITIESSFDNFIENLNMYHNNNLFDNYQNYLDKFMNICSTIEIDDNNYKFMIENLDKSNFKEAKTKKEINKELSNGLEKEIIDDNNSIISNTSSNSKAKITNDITDNITKQDILTKLKEIIKKIIPLLCLLTIYCPNLLNINDMYEELKKNENIYNNIFLNYIKISENININISLFIDNIIIMNQQFLNTPNAKALIKNVKELIVNAKNDYFKLSKLVSDYIIPTQHEKKTNAEVSTPEPLAKEMLETIPDDFWFKHPINKEVLDELKKPKLERKIKSINIGDTSCGKGIFPILLLAIMMDKYKEAIIDEKLRKQFIVEHIIYIGDINPLNIHITKLLLDPDNKYELNYYEGDTLKLDIKKEWDLDGFDLIVGNPPYNNSGGIKKGGKNLYTQFTIQSINNLNKNCYLLYIVPTGIFKSTVYNKKTDIFNLISNNNLLNININECAKHFNVASTFTYFLLKKDNSKLKEINNIVCKINENIYNIDKINNFNLNFIPNLLTEESISILNKCKKETLNMKRIDKTTDIQNLNINKFIYIKRLNHINHKNPYLQVFIGDKNLEIKGPILYTEYNKNTEIFLKSKLMAFINIITRFDGVIYHYFINMFGITSDINIKNDKEIYKYFKLTKEEIELIEENVK